MIFPDKHMIHRRRWAHSIVALFSSSLLASILGGAARLNSWPAAARRGRQQVRAHCLSRRHSLTRAEDVFVREEKHGSLGVRFRAANQLRRRRQRCFYRLCRRRDSRWLTRGFQKSCSLGSSLSLSCSYRASGGGGGWPIVVCHRPRARTCLMILCLCVALGGCSSCRHREQRRKQQQQRRRRRQRPAKRLAAPPRARALAAEPADYRPFCRA